MRTYPGASHLALKGIFTHKVLIQWNYLFMSQCRQQLWKVALCFQVVRPILMNMIFPLWKNFFKFPLGITDKFISSWWTKVKVTVTLKVKCLGWYWGNHMLINTKNITNVYYDDFIYPMGKHTWFLNVMGDGLDLLYCMLRTHPWPFFVLSAKSLD